ncbi:MAG: DEAD/DEAH box helicase [Bauldia sp.]
MKETNYMSFEILGLAEPITRAIREERYETPTPIQAAAIPPVLLGRDLVGIAQTGTGKTAAFALPILDRLAARPARPERKACRVLVLSPTRELSGQIVDSFKTYGRHLRFNVALAIGGVPISRQVRSLAGGVDVLVATPGRLLDLCRSRAVRLDQVEILVLDEADRMLDMGFIKDIRIVVDMLPKKRQTLFFSATMPGEIVKLADSMLTNPVKVAVTPPARTADLVDQKVIHIDRGGKPGLLAEILRGETVGRALVFTRTKHGADKVVRGLNSAGIAADAIHGNKSQGQRDRALAQFRDGHTRTLVATDIAARGIDVDGISHVINFDLPNIADTYVHRIGRTARAGASGIAISFCASDERAFLRDIEKLIRIQIPSERRGPSGPEAVVNDEPQAERNHRPRNGRPQQQRQGQKKGGRPGGQHAANRPRHNQSTRSDDLTGVGFMKPAPSGGFRSRSRAS